MVFLRDDCGKLLSATECITLFACRACAHWERLTGVPCIQWNKPEHCSGLFHCMHSALVICFQWVHVWHASGAMRSVVLSNLLQSFLSLLSSPRDVTLDHSCFYTRDDTLYLVTSFTTEWPFPVVGLRLTPPPVILPWLVTGFWGLILRERHSCRTKLCRFKNHVLMFHTTYNLPSYISN